MYIFSLLSSIFFLSRKMCLLWSPCLLLFAESISLDTSSKPTVGFFLKIASSSGIILPASFDELNSTEYCWRAGNEFSWNNHYFIFAKEFLYGKKYYKFFGEFNWLFSEYYCECQLLWWFEIWILLSTTLKYCYK